MKKQASIRTLPRATCVACGSDGHYLYKNLPDRLFGAGGTWSVKQCNQPSCACLWLDPAPIAEDLHLAYQSYYTHGPLTNGRQGLFSKLTAGYRALHYRYNLDSTSRIQRTFGGLLGLLTFFRESMEYPFIYFKDRPKGKLLELGVGSGNTLKLFADWGWDAEGLDVDPQAVKNAAAKGLNVRSGDLFSPAYPSEQFDAIFSSHVLEHVPDPLAVLSEAGRLLKKGGLLVAVTPNRTSFLHRFFKASWRELDPPRHLYVYTPSALASMAKQAGFTKLEIRSSNYSAAGVCAVSHQIAKHGSANVGEVTNFRYIAQAVRFCLDMITKIKPLSGEELILIAHK